MAANASSGPAEGRDFIRAMIEADLASGKYPGVVTRFPPEPNGYLHIGHAYAICLNFGLAAQYGGRCHLRFDDTNPAAEEDVFVRGIQEDVRWLGFDWNEHLYFASDYFPRLYEYAVELIRRGHAFVCDLSSEEILERRGTLTEPGTPSPYRDRSAEESLDLFQRMRDGEFAPGTRTLRARIDMASPVLPMRDPVLYRIITAPPHHRTGRDWCVYPMYDFAHGLSDAIEGITHSLCTLEYVDHRPLYEWILDALEIPRPRPEQTEFNGLYLTHTVLSKRNLKQLVADATVAGWDDPRLATVAGMRRRGIPPEAIRRLARDVGVTRRPAVTQYARFEHAVRDELNRSARRAMAVLDPLRVVIENYPEDRVEEMEAVNNPEDPAAGTRLVPFSRELYIEREDFLEDPPRKFFRLAPGREVRLRYAYLVTCTGVVKDADGRVVELRCTYDPATRGGDAPDGRRVKGTLHWVSARHAARAEARLYEVLFAAEDPLDLAPGETFRDHLNPDSLRVLPAIHVEPGLADVAPGSRYQFERIGYFCVDPDSRPGRPVFNRIVTLRDTWGRLVRRGRAE